MYYENYQAIRDEKGLTDYQVAKGTGIATSTLSEWKKTMSGGGYTPKVDKLSKIAEFLEVPLSELVDGRDE